MKKRNVYKNFVAFALAICMLIGMGPHVQAAENSANIIIDFEYVDIETEYDSQSYYIEYGIDENGTNYAYIYDRDTGALIEDYEEVSFSSSNARNDYGLMTVQLRNKFYPNSYNVSGTRVAAVVTLEIYRETIAGKIVDTIKKYKKSELQMVESGIYELESQATSKNSLTGDYVKVNCTGVVAAEKEDALEAGVTFNFLKSVGFELSASASEKWIARLDFDKVIKISV